MTGPSAKPTTEDLSWFSTPLRKIKRQNHLPHPQKITKINWHLQKNTVAGINGLYNRKKYIFVVCLFFFWWRCNSGTTRLASCQSTIEVALDVMDLRQGVCSDNPSQTLFRALMNRHGFGMLGQEVLLIFTCTSKLQVFWDFPCKFVWFFQHFRFPLLSNFYVSVFFLSFSLPFWMHIVLKPYSSLWDLIPGIFSVLRS